MESQPLTLTAKPLRTSNNTIFPSLHPFGSLYSQRNLLQKRTYDMLDTQSIKTEPINKLQVTSQSGTYKPVRTSITPQQLPIKTHIPNTVPQIQVKNKPVNGFGLGVPDLLAQLLGVNPFDKVQANLMMEMMKQQMEVLAEHALQQIAPGKVQEFFLQVKPIESMITVSDSSSTVDSENEEETQPGKENQNAQGKKDQQQEIKTTLTVNPLQERKFNRENIVEQAVQEVQKCAAEENNIIEKSVEKITMMRLGESIEEIIAEPEETGMPGFDDKIKTPVPVDSKTQVVLPEFRSFRTEEIRRVPKLVWTPEEEKIEEIKALLEKLGELLGCEITHEQKAWRVYERYSFSMERCLEVIGRQKNKYKTDFKYRRSSNKKFR